jgi:iron-sulfur cluster repair protein YtfE (RIC family)
MKISAQMKVSEIYRLYPAALPVLAKYKIDLCCGGRHELEVVAKKHGLDLARLLEDLQEAIKVAT